MKLGYLAAAPLLALWVTQEALADYTLVRDYSSTSFFDGWDFFGSFDNLTLGNVNYLTEADATLQNLAYVNSQGNAVIKVDNITNVPMNGTRNSIRITTKDFYEVGSLWIIDAVHIPFGCSVWPAFWSTGLNWPFGGEIDIIEAVNQMNHNQVALHTTRGCWKAPGAGNIASIDCSPGSGCVTPESKPNSFGNGFAQAGGGVWATQFDVAGIFVWFWGRADIPDSIKQSTSSSSMDVSGWGPPSASYPASGCNISEFFTAQQLILDITLCGVWAGVPATYNATCSNTGPTGKCYNDNVVGPGSKYDNAYFEIPFIRTYTIEAAAGSPASTSALPAASASTSLSGPPGSTRPSSSALPRFPWPCVLLGNVFVVILFLGFLL